MLSHTFSIQNIDGTRYFNTQRIKKRALILPSSTKTARVFICVYQPQRCLLTTNSCCLLIFY